MTPVLLCFMGMAGACIGSYATTAAVRAGRAEQTVTGRSHCDGCGRTLSFGETLPLISFAMLRGGCRTCGARIDASHLAGEIIGCGVAVCAFAIAPPLRAFLLMILGLVLLAGAVYDAKTRRLPDLWTLVTAGLAATLAALRSIDTLLVGVLAAAVTGGVLLFVRWSFRRLRHRDGLGLGDVKLLISLALWLGIETSWAIAAASAFALAYILIAKPRDGVIAFGPFIASGAWLVGLTQEAGAWPMPY